MTVARETLGPPAGFATPVANAALSRDASAARIAAWSSLFVVAYVALDAASYAFPYGPIPVTPWNPQVGLAMAALFVGGSRFIPATLVATVLAEAIVRGGGGPAFDLVGGICLGVGYAATGIAFRVRNPDRSIARMEVLRDFLLIALVGTAVTASAYVLGYAVVASDVSSNILREALRKWLGDYVGAVAFAPMLLALIDPRLRKPALGRVVLGAILLCAALFVLLALVFRVDPIDGHKLFYLLFVPVIYLAMRHDFAGASFGVACVQVAVVIALIASKRSGEDATDYQLLTLVLAATTLLLGSATTERRRALSELANRSADLRAQQAVLSDAMRVAAASETASTLAHEMSQPLSAIGTYARAGLEMIRRGTAEPGEIAGILERIERETARSSEVVRRVRDFFRTGIARGEPTDFRELARHAIDAVRDRLTAERVSVALEVPDGLPPVHVDPVQVGTVLHNLLGNAIDALASASSPRRIRIAAHIADGRQLEVDIEDTGPGVADAMGTSLFEPLATTKPAGMGLGLAICRTIVQAHGGRLWLASSQPTIFRFTLPIHGQDPS